MPYPQNINKLFGRRVIFHMRQNNLKNKEVAKKINVSETTVGKWTRGGNIKEKHLFLLGDALNVCWLELRYGPEFIDEICKQRKTNKG